MNLANALVDVLGYSHYDFITGADENGNNGELDEEELMATYLSLDDNEREQVDGYMLPEPTGLYDEYSQAELNQMVY
jgi:hypothetical protein